jgi:protein-tyrosine phosphatase
MPEVLDWQQADPRQVFRAAVQHLGEGRLVAFPTETDYVVAASALHADAVARLAPVGDSGRPLALALRSAGEALDWAPGMSALARRLARRCWPGPVILLLEQGVPDGLASRLPEAVRRQLCTAGQLALTVPGHDAILNTLQLLPAPLVTRAARRDGQATTSAADVVQTHGESLALVIDDGPGPLGQAETVVQVNGDRWNVRSEGAVPASLLEQLSSCTIVFVCTGNTCRSPLAEALGKKQLADRLGCGVDELSQRGYLVCSAGLAAMRGGGAAAEAVEAARAFGADLSGHRSQPLTAELLRQADHVIAMTHSHLRALEGPCAQLGLSPCLLSRRGDDIADPVGEEQEVYHACAREIWGHLQDLLPRVLQP